MDELLNTLREFAANPTAQYKWIVDPLVWLDGDWTSFFASFENDRSELLATTVRTRDEFPHWDGWASLELPVGMQSTPEVFASLELVRVGVRAARLILDGFANGWTGPLEVLLPTLLMRNGLKVSDIGGSGSFTPDDRIGCWYDERTWKAKGHARKVSGALHFPVGRRNKSLGPLRLAPFSTLVSDDNANLKALYVTSHKGSADKLTLKALTCFSDASADCWLFHDSSSTPTSSVEIRAIPSHGSRWQEAVRHLSPDQVANYDFIFFWESDMWMKDFDPLRFIKIMALNRLEMAQPGSYYPHNAAHPIVSFPSRGTG